MDVGKAFSESWEVFKKYPLPLVVGYMLLSFLNSATSGFLFGNILAGFAYLVQRAFAGEEPKIEDSFKGFDRFGDKFIAGLLMLSGALACGIGVLVTWFLFLFAPIIVQTKDVTWKEAITESKELVLANVGPVFLLVMAIFLLNLLGTLACCVGVLVTAPLARMIIQHCYVQLAEKA